MKNIKQFWKNLKYWQKGGAIGLLIGIIFAISGTVGILKCGWNPGHLASPEGLCRNPFFIILFYLPLLSTTYLSWLLLSWAEYMIKDIGFVTDMFFLIIIPSLTLIFFCFGVGALIGLVIGKLKKK